MYVAHVVLTTAWSCGEAWTTLVVEYSVALTARTKPSSLHVCVCGCL